MAKCFFAEVTDDRMVDQSLDVGGLPQSAFQRLAPVGEHHAQQQADD